MSKLKIQLNEPLRPKLSEQNSENLRRISNMFSVSASAIANFLLSEVLKEVEEQVNKAPEAVKDAFKSALDKKLY